MVTGLVGWEIVQPRLVLLHAMMIHHLKGERIGVAIHTYPVGAHGVSRGQTGSIPVRSTT